ncbi:uncharacterized protein YALI1_B01725g [Yarrowia lipolytica]|uniref:Uncharacterized protein n=1 Tax=Yarrowia lipolytica TaxID=4952 RepID=A0A1D8N5Z2_YARLL|nr:hypothetical protein YALI1_B01725g [Yarrowia lipolytica]
MLKMKKLRLTDPLALSRDYDTTIRQLYKHLTVRPTFNIHRADLLDLGVLPYFQFSSPGLRKYIVEIGRAPAVEWHHSLVCSRYTFNAWLGITT